MELKTWLKGNVLLLAHVGDMDACASFVAFEELARKISKAKLEFAVSGLLNKDGEKILNLFGLRAKKLSDIETENFQKLVLVDTSEDLAKDVIAKFKDHLVLDHHVQTKEFSYAVSTTEIIYDLFKKNNTHLERYISFENLPVMSDGIRLCTPGTGKPDSTFEKYIIGRMKATIPGNRLGVSHKTRSSREW